MIKLELHKLVQDMWDIIPIYFDVFCCLNRKGVLRFLDRPLFTQLFFVLCCVTRTDCNVG